MEESSIPDPTETVTLLRSDFELLQKAADAAMEDYRQWLELLSVTPPPHKAPREVMYELVFPRVVALLMTQQHVDEATGDLRQMAARFGNKTIELANGVKGVKVGQRDPELARTLSGMRPATRRERRELERRGRREP